MFNSLKRNNARLPSEPARRYFTFTVTITTVLQRCHSRCYCLLPLIILLSSPLFLHNCCHYYLMTRLCTFIIIVALFSFTISTNAIIVCKTTTTSKSYHLNTYVQYMLIHDSLNCCRWLLAILVVLSSTDYYLCVYCSVFYQCDVTTTFMVLLFVICSSSSYDV